MLTTSPTLNLALNVAFEYRYALLILGTIIEGPVVMVASGFLLRLGLFSLVPMFIALAIGDLIADTVWYLIGMRFLRPFLKRRGHFLGVTLETVNRVEGLFKRYHTRILFISKVTMGFGMALGTLMVAGASRVPFKRYLVINALGEIVFVSTMLVLGYVFGHAYTVVANGIRWLFLAGAIATGLVVVFGVSRYARHKLIGT